MNRKDTERKRARDKFLYGVELAELGTEILIDCIADTKYNNPAEPREKYEYLRPLFVRKT